MGALSSVVWTFHALFALLLLGHSLAYLGLALARLRIRAPRPTPAPAPGRIGVTVQVAVRNEPQPLLRCIDRIAALDWPRSLLEVQVLDDSDDPTWGAESVRRLQRQGIDARHLHRREPQGEKAGALQHGLPQARYDVLVPFDVDFEPAPDFLHQITAPLADPSVACVQARWSTNNRTQNLLTRALDVALVGHFRVEQTVRAHHQGLTSFNATACAWRKQDLQEVGGWPADTLTEDLDVAMRVRLRGRRFVYLEALACPSQVPATVSALAVQQARWARGSLHCLRLHWWNVLASPRIQWQRRPGVLFHLSHYSLQPLLLASLATQAALVLLQRTPEWYAAITMTPLFVGPLVMYLVSLKLEAGIKGWTRLAHLPTLAVVGLGLTTFLAFHACLGLAGRRGRFRRTPKDGAHAPHAGHRLPGLFTAAAISVWAVFAWPLLAEPLAAGVLFFGASSLLVALLR